MNINKLVEIIKERKITQEELANHCDVTRPTIKLLLEKGDGKISLVESICKYLNIHITDLIEDTQPKKIKGDNNQVNTTIGNSNNNTNAINASNAEIEALKKELSYMQALLRAKDDLIEELRKKG